MDVELRHLRALVAIADEGTITGAAARLRITQPALSRTLRQLEQRVGATLVDRSTRHLELTPAGRSLDGQAHQILALVDAALAQATARARPLRLGYTWAALGRHTTPLLRRWRASHPHVSLQVHRLDDDRTAGLSRAAVDVALLRTEAVDPAIRCEPLLREPRLAALPEEHPLADRQPLSLDDLADETIAIDPLTGTTTAELWPPEHRPHRLLEVHNVDEWLTVIAAGDAIGVTAAATGYTHPHPGVRYTPLTGAPPITLYLAWPANPTHPSTADFVAHAREIVNS